jgi:Flp pilus assembly protein TadB
MKRPWTVGAVVGAAVGSFWVAFIRYAMDHPNSFAGKGWMSLAFLMLLTCPFFEMWWVAWWLAPVLNALMYAVIFTAATSWIQSRKK